MASIFDVLSNLDIRIEPIEVFGPFVPQRFIYSDVAKWNQEALDGLLVYPQFAHSVPSPPKVYRWTDLEEECIYAACVKEFSADYPDPPEFVEVVW